MADQSGSKWMFWLIQGQLSKASFYILAHEQATNSRFYPYFQLSGCHVWHGQQQQCNSICWRNIHGCFCVLSDGKIQCSWAEGNFQKKSLKQAFSISFSLCFSDCVVFLWPDGDRSVSSLLFWSLLLLQALLNANATNGSILAVGNWRGRYICYC